MVGPVGLFGAFLSLVTLSIPFSSDLLTCDPAATLRGFADLFGSSRFVAVAAADIGLMSVVAALLASEDAGRRGWEDRAPAVFAASLLLPVLGPSLYLAARPPLPEAP